jgi:hypothetical protein
MSSYRIYQSDHSDPKLAGKKIRRQVILSVSIISILILIFLAFLVVFKMSEVLLLALFIPLVVLFIYYFYKLGSKIRNLKIIGEIDFSRTSIRKKIGDSITEYQFQTIQKFELQKHLPIVGISGTLSDNFTYILKIIFLNSSSESMVVSNQPIDPRSNISIVETMKTLKKFIKSEIVIET